MERSCRRKWSAEEDKILRDHWHNGEPIRMWIDRLPGRNEAAAIQRAPKLKLGPRGSGCKAGNSPTWRMICQVLKSGEALSALEISKRIGISRQHVYEELRNHHPAEVHIGDYGARVNDAGYPPKLWELGPGKDEKRPKPLTQTEINRRRWLDAKQSRPRRDEAAAWLTGGAA